MKAKLPILLGPLALLAACSRAPEPGAIANTPAAAPAAIAAPAPAAATASASAPEGWFRARLAAASGGDIKFLVDGQARLEPEPGTPTTRWRLVGRQVLSVVWIHCTPTAQPAEQPLEDASLQIDRASSPPRYTLRAGRVWEATVTGGCPGQPGTASMPMRVPGRLEVSGTLGADGRAAGERRDGDLAWSWSLPAAP